MADSSNDAISSQETGGSKPDENTQLIGTTVQVKSGKCTSKIVTVGLLIVLLVIVLLLFVGLILVIVKYTLFIRAVCHSINNTNGVADHLFYVNGIKIETGSYMHVMLVIFSASLSVIRILEYVMLAWGTQKWLSHKLRSGLPAPSTACCCGCNSTTFFTVVLVLCLLGLEGAAVYFAIKMELVEEKCRLGYNEYGAMVGVMYMVHCGLDFFSTGLACAVRVWMINHTYNVKKIWSIAKTTNAAAKDVTKELATEILSKKENVKELAEDAFYNEYEVEYEKKGEQAKEQMLPFVPWFLFPWLHFVVLTVINPHLLLTPWTHDNNGHKSEIILWSWAFYFVIVIVYFVQILIQNACAMRMNQYHKDYHRDMKNRVVHIYGRCTNDDSVVDKFKKRYIFKASQISMKCKDEYNFYPTFFSFFTNMNVENPYILLVLIVGIVVSASTFLFK